MGRARKIFWALAVLTLSVTALVSLAAAAGAPFCTPTGCY